MDPRLLPLLRLHAALLCLLLLGFATAGCGSGNPDGASREQVLGRADQVLITLDDALTGVDERLMRASEAALTQLADGNLSTITPGALSVGTNADFLPFVGVEGGAVVGFDIDLFNAVATRMGLVATYTDMSFTGLTGAMTAGDIDVIVAAFTITRSRDEVVDFSRPYFVASQALGVPLGSPIRSVADLGPDSTLAVLEDTTGEQYAADSLSQVTTVAYRDRQSAVSAVNLGSADALLMDIDAVGEEARAEGGNLMLVQEVPTGERYGYAVREGNVALQLALDEAIAGVIADGTYAEIFTRWFPGRDVDQAVSVLQ